jgi:hypothetical protein
LLFFPPFLSLIPLFIFFPIFIFLDLFLIFFYFFFLSSFLFAWFTLYRVGCGPSHSEVCNLICPWRRNSPFFYRYIAPSFLLSYFIYFLFIFYRLISLFLACCLPPFLFLYISFASIFSISLVFRCALSFVLSYFGLDPRVFLVSSFISFLTHPEFLWAKTLTIYSVSSKSYLLMLSPNPVFTPGSDSYRVYTGKWCQRHRQHC